MPADKPSRYFPITPAAPPILNVEGCADMNEVRYAIIGAGLPGIGMAMRLKASGRRDFLILEKSAEVGGYWRDADWPGSAGDMPSHLSAFSFAPRYDWPRKFPTRGDMLEYMDRLISDNGLTHSIEFNAEVISLRYLGELQRWQIELRNGRYLRAEYVMLGMEALSRPEIPPISGLGDFHGPVFHASDWDHELDLAGRRVACIGNGDSTAQFVPRVVSDVEQLTLFQSEPVWVLPRQDRSISKTERALFVSTPWLQERQRGRLFRHHEAGFPVVLPGSRRHIQTKKRALAHLRRQVSNLQKRRLLTPDYPIGSRAIRYSDDFYPAMDRENVRLVASAVREVTQHHVISEDGSRCEADIIVLGTAFRRHEAMIPPGLVIGPKGVDLGRHWQTHGVSNYRGLCAPGMPNLFLLNGPNTGLRHSSPLLMLESQMDHIIHCLSHMDRHGLRQFEVRGEAAERFAGEMRQASRERVWGSPVQSRALSRGIDSDSVNLWPHDVRSYQKLMDNFNEADYLWR